MHLKIGSYLQGGKYRIVRFIKSGGFGCTYEALHTVFGNRFAIKEFFPKDFCNRDADTHHVTVGTQSKKALVSKLKSKFIDEAVAIHNLSHPGIVKVSDVFEENGTAYYVMDYIDGCSLDDLVKREGTLSEQNALGYIRQVCEALSYVHSQKRLHLDIKPGNIMLDGCGRAILIDFGTSRQYDEVNGENTSTLLPLTPGYAPTEQYRRDGMAQFTPVTDVYSLGATLYKLLTGVTPVDAPSRACGESLAPLPSCVSQSVSSAVQAAMSLDMAMRPQSVDEFLFLVDEGTVVPPPPPPPPPPPVPKPRKWLWALLVGMAVVINIYGLFVVFDITNYRNMTYPHVLLLCLLVLFTSMGVSAVWLLNFNYKRSKLMKTVIMLLLLSAGVYNSYLFAFEMPYIVKDDDCDNVYIIKWGVMPSDHDYKYMVQDDIIPFKQWGKYGLKNGSTGEIVLSARYEYIGLWDIATQEYNYDTGEWSPLRKAYDYDKENNVIFEVERDGKHGVLNVKGDVVVPVVYDYWEYLRNSDDKYIVDKDGRYGIITIRNEEILPLDYSGIDDSQSNSSYIIAAKNGCWGVTDLKSSVHVPFEYDDIELADRFETDNGYGEGNLLFAYKRNGSWGVKDTSGNEYLSCEYDKISSYSIMDFLEYGYWAVKKAGKVGVLNNASEVIVPFEYDSIRLYGSEYGLFIVLNFTKMRGIMSGVVNLKNEVILPLRYSDIHINESTIVLTSNNRRKKEIYNHLGERIN